MQSILIHDRHVYTADPSFHFDDEGGRWTMEWFEDEEQDTWMI